ncbi:MAG: C25 family cysteine peptidase [Proteobacteria bacterium]|nr:C25 family cysteine peptidase [Pseudomonadota bacterium]
MKVRFIVGLILSLFIVSSSSALEIELVSHSNQGVTIKVNLPDFRSEKKLTGDYQCITVDGWGRTETDGSPQLPTRGILVGIPSRVMVKAEIIQGNAEEISGLNIYPCPQKAVEEKGGEISLKEVFYQDKEVYSKDSYTPGKLVQVSETGYMRGQRVAKIDIYPFQYNPVKKKLKVYREVLIRVSFEGGEIEPLPFSKEELPYEQMLQKLLVNYESLGRYERESVERGGGTVQEKAGAGSISNLKIHLSSEGIYKIGYSDLSSLSLWSLTIDPQKIHLKHLGAEIPILFEGESDGKFNLSDYFLFYAPPLVSPYTDYTKDDVYWLSVESDNGLRMSMVDGNVGSGQLLTSFTNLYHGEENPQYWETIPNGDGQDHYFWKKLQITQANTPVSTDDPALAPPITFTLNNILSTSEDCSLTFSFRGKTNDSASPDHHTQIIINGNIVSDDWWDAQIEFQNTVTFPQSYLINGTNNFTVKSLGDTEAGYNDIVFFNWFDLTYEDTYVAESNLLKFKGEGTGNYQMEVSGFTSSEIFLFDITDAVKPQQVTGTTTTKVSSTYTLNFENAITGSEEYMAVTSGGTQTPALIEADVPSSLKSASNSADYIIITHEDFYDAIQPLATYRASQGKRVMVVKVGDLYDEFSYGLFTPQAIKDFLTYAYENYQKPAPLYCLLVGDANIDYKDNLATGRKNYVPTHIFQTDELGDTPTDNWFACVAGDDVMPDMYIGRISIQAASEATNVVNKILGYEQAGSQSWNKQILFVADNESSFESVDDTLANSYLPGDYQAFKVYLSQYSSAATAKSDLMNDFDNGQLITVYVGHGSVDNWAAEYLFTSDDVPSLNNSSAPTFVVTLTCLNGFFASPVDDYCLGETFLNGGPKEKPSPVGAIGCLVPTSLGFTWEHSQLAQELFDSIFQSGHNLLGQATTEAKINAYSQGVPSDIIQAFVLLGDPLSALKASLNSCSEWSDVIAKYNEYVSGLAAWSDVIDCYNGYVSQ